MVALWMPWIRLRQRQRFGTSTLARPASLHPVLGSSLGTDLIFEFGPNLKNPRLDARPCSAGRHARTAGPILQKEPTDGGVSGGVGRSQWWPSGCHGFGSGSCGDSVHLHSHGLRRFILCSAHLWEPTSSLSWGRI